MQRLVIDTNVLVSALIQESYPYFILNLLILDEELIWCISQEVFREYQEVLRRPKFSKYGKFTENAELLLNEICLTATAFVPTVKVDIIKDAGDNKFLELAQTSNANFLITGNTRDFIMDSFGDTKIVSPKDYWEIHR